MDPQTSTMQPPDPTTQAPAIQPAPPAPVPHAQLLSMIQGLGVGLGAFGKAIATHGREGGVQDVQAYQQNQQAMQLREQQNQRANAQEQRETAESQSLISYQTAQSQMLTAQLHVLNQNAPLEHQKLQANIDDSLIDLADKLNIPRSFSVPYIAGQSTDDHIQAVTNAAGPVGGLGRSVITSAHDPGGAGFGSGEGKTVGHDAGAMFNTAIPADDPRAKQAIDLTQQQVDMYKGELGADNKAVQQAQAKLDFIKKQSGAGMSVLQFGTALHDAVILPTQAAQRQQQVTEFKEKQADAAKKQQESDPLFKMENDPKTMEGPAAASAVPLLQNKIATETDPVQKMRETRLLAQAQSAHKNYLTDISSKASAEAIAGQSARQGDPASAGALLASGDLTLSDLKSRGTTPKFIIDATKAAKKVKPDYNPADEVIAEHVAQSPTQNQFFGSANSLITKGGTADQLLQISKSIPQNDIPILNTVEDWEKLKTGKGPLAGYASVALGVADDYGKVMGGGTASDTARNSALAIIGSAQSPEQRQSAIDGIRGAVKSQRDSRIGKNQFLQRAYGQNELGGQETQSSAAPSGATHKVPGPDGKLHYTNAQGTVDLGVVPNGQ